MATATPPVAAPALRPVPHAVPPRAPSLAPSRAPSRAHWWLLATLGAIVAGFWPSFFARLAATDLAHVLHGFSATGWVLALALQAWLIARGRRAWHRRVAVAAIVLALVMVVTSLPMVRTMLATAQREPAARGMLYQLAVFDVGALALFVGLLAVALAYVRRPALHRRCMAATALIAFPPAFGRLFDRVVPGLELIPAVHLSFLVTHATLAALLVADRRAGERSRAYAVTLACFVLLQVALAPVAGTAWWHALAQRIAGV